MLQRDSLFQGVNCGLLGLDEQLVVFLLILGRLNQVGPGNVGAVVVVPDPHRAQDGPKLKLGVI